LEPALKLIHHQPDVIHALTGHGPGYVLLNEARVEHSLVVSPVRCLMAWAPDFEALTQAHFEALLELEPEVVLLGTGRSLRFPHPSLTQALVAAGIGLEVMDTQAACRTYAVLASEGRRVVAALILP
jgi:uncharacterized protein